jgi:hypothetical protein
MRGFQQNRQDSELALARLKTLLCLIDNIDTALAADQLIVSVARAQ